MTILKKQYHAFMAVFVCCLPVWGVAQTVERDVVALAGDFQHHPDFGSLHWTLGEMSVETYTQGAIQLGQGFHQYTLLVVAVEEPNQWEFDALLFPNPTTGLLYLQSGHEGQLWSIITDMTGREVQRQTFSAPTTQPFDLGQQPSGTYVLRILDGQGHSRSFKVVKTQ